MMEDSHSTLQAYIIPSIFSSNVQVQVTVIAGNGTSSDADGYPGTSSLDRPSGLAWDSSNDVLYIADYNNNKVHLLVNQVPGWIHVDVVVSKFTDEFMQPMLVYMSWAYRLDQLNRAHTDT